MPTEPPTLADYDYFLPSRLIAQAPLPRRSASRLLEVADEALEDRGIADLAQLLQPGDLLVMNDTRVLHARLFGSKSTGGSVEVLASRAKHYGLSVEAYKKNNLLKVEVTSRDVAELAAEMCGSLFAKTTGAQLPVDGGNDRVI